jgi:hypothetical protein
VRTPAAPRRPGSLQSGKSGKILNPLCIRKAQEEQTPAPAYWNLANVAELPAIHNFQVYEIANDNGFRLSCLRLQTFRPKGQ